MVSNVTDINDIAVSIMWNPPTDSNGFIRYYRVQYVQASDPLADTGGTDDSRKRNVPLDTITVVNEFANITDGGAGPLTSIILSGLG